MRKWKTSSGIEIFQVLSGRSNSYLIRYEKGNILVDTGKTSAFDELVESLRQLRVQMNEVGYLVLTHTHFDHCQNAAKLKSSGNCQIIVGEPEAIFAESGYTPLPKGVFLLTRIISTFGNWIGKARFGYEPIHPDILIQDETSMFVANTNRDEYSHASSIRHLKNKLYSDETKLDDRVKIVPTPGHSAGSISLIIDNEIALVGDALFGVFRNSVLPPFADDFTPTIKSWGTLLASGCRTFLPGHGRPITRDLLQRELEKFSEKN